jgi:hypothetical protein
MPTAPPQTLTPKTDQRGAEARGSGGASGALSPASLGRSESPLRSARGSGENEVRLGFCMTEPKPVLFGRKPRATIGLRWTAHRQRTEFQPRRDESFPAQAQVAAWSTGRAEREQAAGRFSTSGRFPTRRAKCLLSERAVGRFHLRAKFHSEQ